MCPSEHEWVSVRGTAVNSAINRASQQYLVLYSNASVYTCSGHSATFRPIARLPVVQATKKYHRGQDQDPGQFRTMLSGLGNDKEQRDSCALP